MSNTQSATWAPAPDQNPRAVNPMKDARQIVGVIKGQQGQKLDRLVYLSLLADRLQYLVNRSPNPRSALDDLYESLQKRNLLESRPSLKTAGSDLANDPLLQNHLQLMNLPGKLPASLQNDHRAENLFQRVNLEQWITALLLSPNENPSEQ